MLIIDGTDPELIKNILETDSGNMQKRHKVNKAIFEYLGSVMPTFFIIVDHLRRMP